MKIICLDKNYTVFALLAVSQQNCCEQNRIILTLVERWTLVLCMGCHPHTRVNPAQHTVRKEMQELMWLQAI